MIMRTRRLTPLLGSADMSIYLCVYIKIHIPPQNYEQTTSEEKRVVLLVQPGPQQTQRWQHNRPDDDEVRCGFSF